MAKKSRANAAQAAESTAATGTTPNAATSAKGKASSTNPQAQQSRQEYLDRRQRRPQAVQQKKEERLKTYEKNKRNALWTKIGFGVLAGLILVWAGWWGWGRWQAHQVNAEVTTYFGAGDFAGLHESGEILYEEVPPVGGPHNAVWQNCGYYSLPINNVNGVHSLEHGAVWITYDPNLSADQVQQLKDLTKQTYVLVSPYPNLPGPVVASVWGKQMVLDSFDISKLKTFISEYKQNPDNTPERGALCTLGTSAVMQSGTPQSEPYVRADKSAPPIGGVTVEQATATAQAVADGSGTPEGTAEAAATSTPTAVAGPAMPGTPAAGASPAATPSASPQASPEASPEAGHHG
ncbi:MAG TPA: DUF3105 domain-containing protein [Thermomicrobiales bacterium]|nr:DUF3105 domain-containing protein [Thermomicrobiales bacterium]